MKLLAISGSLRAASCNAAAIEAARRLAPAGVEIVLYRGLADLPHFNPDTDVEPPPAAVAALRALVGACAGILIACPEYAHGVPGSLKNALDWLVSSLEFPGKPVALINAAPHAFRAQAALRETLATMSADLIPDGFVSLPLPKGIDAAGILADARLSEPLQSALRRFVRAIADGVSEGEPELSDG